MSCFGVLEFLGFRAVKTEAHVEMDKEDEMETRF